MYFLYRELSTFVVLTHKLPAECHAVGYKVLYSVTLYSSCVRIKTLFDFTVCGKSRNPMHHFLPAAGNLEWWRYIVVVFYFFCGVSLCRYYKKCTIVSLCRWLLDV